MAQGMGTDRSGVAEALASIRGAIVRQLEAT